MIYTRVYLQRDESLLTDSRDNINSISRGGDKLPRQCSSEEEPAWFIIPRNAGITEKELADMEELTCADIKHMQKLAGKIKKLRKRRARDKDELEDSDDSLLCREDLDQEEVPREKRQLVIVRKIYSPFSPNPDEPAFIIRYIKNY